MDYSDFSLNSVKKSFNLKDKTVNLFPALTALEPSNWLKETLEISVELSLNYSSEKARSEFIIAPILIELEKRNYNKIAIFSGERLDIDEEKGLKGECDFILGKSPLSLTLESPIFCLVKAKKNDIKEGLGQCVAQMLGATIFNQRENNPINRVYGCVTTGEDWQFLKLENEYILINIDRYYLSEINKILAIFQAIIDSK